MPGRLIVLEGVDGSGKATQTRLLYEALCRGGTRAMQVTFPHYESDSSALVKMYLQGVFGQNVNDVNAYAASAFYTVDRYASYRTDWGAFYNGGGTVVADRYTTSNAVHQCSKLPRAEWDAYLNWLFDFEYQKIAIPEPDTVIYLDVAPDVAERMMERRYQGDENKKDLHEKDKEYLWRSREAGQYCIRKFGWKCVECTKNGEMRPPEEILETILSLIAER